MTCRRSRKGAWIEIEDIFKLGFVTIVAPVRERGLKYDYHEDFVLMYLVAPVRERGLKLPLIMHSYLMLQSLP